MSNSWLTQWLTQCAPKRDATHPAWQPCPPFLFLSLSLSVSVSSSSSLFFSLKRPSSPIPPSVPPFPPSLSLLASRQQRERKGENPCLSLSALLHSLFPACYKIKAFLLLFLLIFYGTHHHHHLSLSPSLFLWRRR